MKVSKFAPLLLVVAFGACAPASRQSPEIIAQADRWEEALNAGDLDALVALYTEDARLLPPNAERGQGHDAARAAFGGMISAGLKGELETIEAVAAGDIGYEVGTYSLQGPDGAVVDRGKYIVVWRLVNGEWQLANDIWNSDMPVPFGGATVLATHEVADPAHWRAAWQGPNSRHQMFAQHGAPNVRLYQSASNPRLTGLLIEVSDMNALQAMLNSPEGAAAKRQDGVRDPTLRLFMEMK